jgi:hypothetical protein
MAVGGRAVGDDGFAPLDSLFEGFRVTLTGGFLGLIFDCAAFPNVTPVSISARARKTNHGMGPSCALHEGSRRRGEPRIDMYRPTHLLRISQSAVSRVDRRQSWWWETQMGSRCCRPDSAHPSP